MVEVSFFSLYEYSCNTANLMLSKNEAINASLSAQLIHVEGSHYVLDWAHSKKRNTSGNFLFNRLFLESRL